MIKKIPLYLYCGFIFCSHTFAQEAPQQITDTPPILSMDEQSLVGNWHCQTNTPTLRYNIDVSTKANRAYNDKVSGSMLINGKWVSINFKGTGHWSIQPNKTLILSNYTTTALQLNNMSPQDQKQAKTLITNPMSQNAKIVRLGAKMLVVEYKDHQHKITTSRCTKRGV